MTGAAGGLQCIAAVRAVRVRRGCLSHSVMRVHERLSYLPRSLSCLCLLLTPLFAIAGKIDRRGIVSFGEALHHHIRW